jgi:hypothetical protein
MTAARRRVLIFAAGGTLADTERGDHRLAFNPALRDSGLNWAGTSRPTANCWQ